MTMIKDFGWFVLKVYLALAAINFVMGLLPVNLSTTLSAFQSNPTSLLGLRDAG
jgi:hypothetical protein